MLFRRVKKDTKLYETESSEMSQMKTIHIPSYIIIGSRKFFLNFFEFSRNFREIATYFIIQQIENRNSVGGTFYVMVFDISSMRFFLENQQYVEVSIFSIKNRPLL